MRVRVHDLSLDFPEAFSLWGISMTENTEALTFKIADEPWELERICQLNYRTFVEEIPQHAPNQEKALVDKFHSENTYVIALQGKELVGMLAGRSKRPFSLDSKLDNLDQYLRPGRKVLEVRLLSVEPGKRGSRIAAGVMSEMLRFGLAEGIEDVIISGTTRQLKLYTKLGFEPFGPLVGNDPEAMFQPMMLSCEKLFEKAHQFAKLMPDDVKATAIEFYQSKVEQLGSQGASRSERPKGAPTTAREEANLLPGPVNIKRSVRQVFAQDPVSHRAEFFVEDFQRTKRALCSFVNTKNVEIVVGTGTMANDLVGGQIMLLDQPGLMLSNGEFGDRLIDHATRYGLEHSVVREDWGKPFDVAKIRAALDERPDVGWMWATHCETSTGILNPVDELKALCAEKGVKLCLDGVSAIGAVPVDLSGVYLCSGSSGKAIGGFPGLSMVFYSHSITSSKRLPRYLDLGMYADNQGIAYTHSSNLVYALKEAIDTFEGGFEKVRALSDWMRERVEGMGLKVVAPYEHASPAVISIEIPDWVSSKEVGDRAYENGYLLSYMSGYLLKRNWVQICLMGDLPQANLEPVLNLIGELCAEQRRVA